MAKVTLTVEYKDKPSKSVTLWPDEAVSHLRELAFKISISDQYVGVYMTKAEVLKYLKKGDE